MIHTAGDVSDTEILQYHARGPKLDLLLAPKREGNCSSVSGQLLSHGQEATVGLVVELLDQLGVMATTETDAQGDFDFSGLTRGVYHLRIDGGDWKIGVFGLTV